MTEQVGSESAQKEERKPVKKVIDGDVIQRKKPLGRKIVETFTGDDVQGVGSYVMLEVILPSVKMMIVDAGTQAIERIFLGDARPRRSTSASPLVGTNRSRNSSYNSYNRYFQGGSEQKTTAAPVSERSRPSYEVMEIVVQSRVDAQEVIDNLQATLSQYPTVSVAELYESVGVTSKFTDNNWGWDRETFNAGVSRIREGFRVDLPRPISIA